MRLRPLRVLERSVVSREPHVLQRCLNEAALHSANHDGNLGVVTVWVAVQQMDQGGVGVVQLCDNAP